MNVHRSAVLAALLAIASCTGPVAPPSTATGGDGTLEILMTAGPTCPVVQDPPDPNCADRAVGNELVVVSRADGTVVESRRTDPEGRTSFTLPAGSYSVLPGNESGYMGAPGPSVVIIRSGAVSRVDFSYDTGIR